MNAKCSQCGVEKETNGNRIPSGWKHPEEKLFCGKCWKSQYFMRAVTVPVASPLNIEWEEFRELLKRSWSQSTALSNWTVLTLAKKDIVRTPDMEKCPPLPKVYLYPEARAFMPDCPPTSLNAITRLAEQKYRSSRFDVVWRHAAALPTYRYPTPFPVPSKDWSVKYLSPTERVPVLNIRLCDKDIDLRLRGGFEFARQLASISKLISGEAVKSAAAIYQIASNPGDHRNGSRHRETRGGENAATRVMVKLVMWLPRADRVTSEKTMTLVTADDCLLVGLIDGQKPWRVNADRIRGKIIEHQKFSQRLREDMKFERRSNRASRDAMQDEMRQHCRKQNNRLTSYCHELSASVVNLARRNYLSEIRFDDQKTATYMPSFPWYQLKTLIKTKGAEYGIAFRECTVLDEFYKKPISDSVREFFGFFGKLDALTAKIKEHENTHENIETSNEIEQADADVHAG